MKSNIEGDKSDQSAVKRCVHSAASTDRLHTQALGPSVPDSRAESGRGERESSESIFPPARCESFFAIVRPC